MPSVAWDRRNHIVTVDYADGRVIDDTGIDIAIKSVDWNAPRLRGRTLYTAAARAVHHGKPNQDADDVEIGETGQKTFTDENEPIVQTLLAAWTAAEPPPPDPVDKFAAPLGAQEMEDLLIDKGVLTIGDVTAKKARRP